MIRTSNIQLTGPSPDLRPAALPSSQSSFICKVRLSSTAALGWILIKSQRRVNGRAGTHTHTWIHADNKIRKLKGESSSMSLVSLPALSVCSLISSSVSSCVPASLAGLCCYHGDESRHRLSAVISCMLPTGIFLDSPLVIICVSSLYREATFFSSF